LPPCYKLLNFAGGSTQDHKEIKLPETSSFKP